MISYNEFGNLNFLDFFPRTPAYYDDDVGGTVTSIGYACVAGYGFTSFARIEGDTGTGAINLDFSHDCPEVEGNTLLTRLGLGLLKGTPATEVINQLGTPQNDRTNPRGFRFCSFDVGENWRYRVSCAFDQAGKLYQVGVARNDLVEKNEEAP